MSDTHLLAASLAPAALMFLVCRAVGLLARLGQPHTGQRSS